jgi:hypothetical protein
MVGKRFIRELTEDMTLEVEVISETLTHVYVKVIKPETSHPGWNLSKGYFMLKYKEIV